MRMRVQRRPVHSQPATFQPIRGGTINGRCACGSSTGLGGECSECRRQRGLSAAGSRLSAITNGKPAMSSREEEERLRIDGNGPSVRSADGGGGGSGGPAGGSGGAGGGKGKGGAPTCPSDIRVVAAGTIELNENDAAQGWWTGWGGFAQMEVSDPSGRNWNGTRIHEELTTFHDGCGFGGACSNEHGEGGSTGSTFTVGEGTNLLGMGSLAGERNRFYDLHITALQGVSALHAAGRNTCNESCYQTYDCGGRQIGPAFFVDRLFYRDMLVGEDTIYDVTKIDLFKSAQRP